MALTCRAPAVYVMRVGLCAWRGVAYAMRAVRITLQDSNQPGKVVLRRARGTKQAELLNEARLAIRLGFLVEAELILQRAEQMATGSADCMNVLGVTCELRCEWKQARKCYGKAMRRDRHYAPAEQNMRRLYELNTFGRTSIPIQLGDERPALAALLREINPAEGEIHSRSSEPNLRSENERTLRWT